MGLAEVQRALREADARLLEALQARLEAVRRWVQQGGRLDTLEGPAAMLRRALDSEACSLGRQQLEPVLREVWSATVAAVQPLEVGYVGPEGGLGELAAWELFGTLARLHAYGSVQELLEDVVRERVLRGVLPFEGSAEGTFTPTLLGLLHADVQVVAERSVPVRWHLVGTAESLASVERVYGEPSALAACQRFLRTHLPKVAVVDVLSTRIAVEFAAQGPSAAAIATDGIRRRLGILGEPREGDLRLLQEGIEDTAGQTLRFVVVGGKPAARTGCDRTLVAFALRDEPGALYEALQPLARRRVNMAWLESRRTRDPAWEQVVFCELEGHVTDRPIAVALEELRARTRALKVLGSYPKEEG